MQHYSLFIFLAIALASPQAQSMALAQTIRSRATVTGSALLAVTAAWYGYRHWFFVPDTTMPTLTSLQPVTFIPLREDETYNASAVLTDKEAIKKALKQQKFNTETIVAINGALVRVQHGIPETLAQQPSVTIYSVGCCGTAYSAYVAMKAGNINGACITFTNPTLTRRAFNFCQEQDMACLDLLYQAVIRQSPTIDVVLYGPCKGGVNILRYITTCAEQDGERALPQVKAVCIESPTISVEKAIGQYPLVHWLTTCIFPNYDPQGTTILDATCIPKHIPIFIGRLPHDTTSKYDDNTALAQHLQRIGGMVTLFTTQEPAIVHGQLGRADDYQKALTAFLKKHGLAHRAEHDSALAN